MYPNYPQLKIGQVILPNTRLANGLFDVRYLSNINTYFTVICNAVFFSTMNLNRTSHDSISLQIWFIQYSHIQHLGLFFSGASPTKKNTHPPESQSAP